MNTYLYTNYYKDTNFTKPSLRYTAEVCGDLDDALDEVSGYDSEATEVNNNYVFSVMHTMDKAGKVIATETVILDSDDLIKRQEEISQQREDESSLWSMRL